MALTSQQLSALTRATAQVRKDIRGQTERAVLGAWDGLKSYRDPEVRAFVSAVAPVVRSAQQATAQVTEAYMSAATDTAAAGVIDLGGLRGGLPIEEEYARPATTLYTDLSRGSSFQEAFQKAQNRLFWLIATDLQLAHTYQAQKSLTYAKQEGYRRVVSGNKSCGLCLIASTQLYTRGDLMPIHPGCQCSVEPYSGHVDLGSGGQLVIDGELLSSIHDVVEDQFGSSDWGARDLGLSKTSSKGKKLSDYTDLMMVRQHGEYGPTLTWRRDRFTGPNNLD